MQGPSEKERVRAWEGAACHTGMENFAIDDATKEDRSSNAAAAVALTRELVDDARDASEAAAEAAARCASRHTTETTRDGQHNAPGHRAGE